ncbi:MAG: histidine phosphatase family protein [Acidobacteria bacterium]|nr:histidine phosphatase family protein [Acidobacteriota bacterium]
MLLGLFLALGLLLGAQDTTVVLFRHAEKAGEKGDVELSEAGRRRAERLAVLLVPMKPQVLFASDRRRTRQTLAPLASRAGLQVLQRPAGEEEALAREILARHRGLRVVVCGHSDTLATLARGLGVTGPFPPVTGYEGLWILRIPPSGPVLLESREQEGPPIPPG